MRIFSLRSALFSLGVIASAVGAAAPALAADIFVSVDAAKQGRLAGESTLKGAEKKFVALSLSYEVKSPRDTASGMATGRRQHGPVCIQKAIGAASPQLFQALISNEPLKNVLFEFQRGGVDGRAEIYHTIKLGNAVVQSYRILKEAGGADLEEICFSFQRIELENKAGKTIAIDDAQGPAALRRK